MYDQGAHTVLSGPNSNAVEQTARDQHTGHPTLSKVQSSHPGSHLGALWLPIVLAEGANPCNLAAHEAWRSQLSHTPMSWRRFLSQALPIQGVW